MSKKLEFGFCPYIGKHYSEANKKLLIVGASHYCAADDFDSDFTINCMKKYLNYKQGVAESPGGYTRTYTRFANVAIGRKLSSQEVVAFYQKIAYYNYLQDPEGDTAKDKHPDKFNEEKHLCLFKKVLNELKPDIAVIWGEKVWQTLPKSLYQDWGRKQLSDNGLSNERHGRLWEYCMEYGPVIFCAVYHPCSLYFNYERFSPLLKRLNLQF